jgi:hypothetical protein
MLASLFDVPAAVYGFYLWGPRPIASRRAYGYDIAGFYAPPVHARPSPRGIFVRLVAGFLYSQVVIFR